jgi:DNA-binding MarR family transcriptional regulator
MVDKKKALIEIGEREEPDSKIRTFILFTQTTREVVKYVDAHLYREAGSSATQLIVLQALKHNEGMMTPSEISTWTQTERHNITTLIRRMKKAGLVTSERNSRNKKIVNVIITDKGRKALEQIMPVAHKIVDRVMMSMNENDAVLLEKLLRLIRQNAHSGLEQIDNNPLTRQKFLRTS